MRTKGKLSDDPALHRYTNLNLFGEKMTGRQPYNIPHRVETNLRATLDCTHRLKQQVLDDENFIGAKSFFILFIRSVQVTRMSRRGGTYGASLWYG